MRDRRTSAKDALFEAPGPKTKKVTLVGTILSLILIAVLLVLMVRRFYVTGQLAWKHWNFFTQWTTWRFLFRGLGGTLLVAAVSGVLAFVAGFLLMVGRISPYRILRGISTALIEFTRGVPTLLFIYFFFLAAPKLGLILPSFWRITLPVAISACGVVAEVLRSGVNAVPRGQKEAAQALGMLGSHVFLRVVFPQALRYVIPALISELVIVVKDTTFAYVVNYPDLMQNSKVLMSNYDSMLSVYLVIALVYILINFLLNQASDAVARRRRRTAPARQA